MTTLDAILRGPVEKAARALLGMRLCSDVGGRRVAVVLTETEAYGGADDPASHAYRGRTARNASMFGPAGTLYVYRSYGIHWCANVVCGEPGSATAVLLRGGAVSEGEDVARRRRGRHDHLADGPGKLAQALGISGALDGSSALTGPVRLVGPSVGGAITVAPRVGISRATDRPWRFLLAARPVDNPRA